MWQQRNICYDYAGISVSVGYEAEGRYHDDMALSFGLHSAPFIFTSVEDMVDCTLTHNHGVDLFRHHLSDFLTLGPLSPDQVGHLFAAVPRLGLILTP